jgi:hypothetical protein
VAALADIHEAAQNMTEAAAEGVDGATTPPASAKPNSQLFIIDEATLNRLLLALNESV